MMIGAETVTEETSGAPNTFFAQQAMSLPQLLIEHETQRRLADVYLGLQQSAQWQNFGAIEARKGVAIKSLVESSEAISFLELKTEEEFVGGVGGFPTPFAAPFSAPSSPHKSSVKEVEQLEQASSLAKLSALKLFQIQVYLTSSDVEKSYWVNRVLSLSVPQQMMVFKLYKNYLSTYALSLALQLSDVFTFEAHIDDFNDRYLSDSGVGSELTEFTAEQTVYQTWYSLASIKLQLFYIHLYEQSFMTQMASKHHSAAASFLEVEETLKANPENPQPQMQNQYAMLSYYAQMLKLYSIFTELSLAQTGYQAATLKVQAFNMANDNDASNDEEAARLEKQATALEGTSLPAAFSQWGQISSMRFYLDYYVLMLDINVPAILPARAAERSETAIESLNLIQTEKK